jgi:DNA-directed RNA polymerase I, II, and III subunit RPABC1
MEQQALEILKGMLNARNYKVESHELVSNKLEDTNMYLMDGVLVIVSEKSRTSDRDLEAYIKFSIDNSYTNGIIVVSQVSSSERTDDFVRQYINVKENPMLQIFDIKRLQFDITKHRKVPKHRILSDDEIKKKLTDHPIRKISIKELPWIDSQDAMAKWIGARPGDVIEIERYSESAGNYLY